MLIPLLLLVALHTVGSFAVNIENPPSDIIYYIPSLVGYVWFGVSVFLLRYKPNVHYRICTFHVPHNMLVFYTMFLLWWVGYTTYSFLSEDPFFHTGIHASMSVSLAFLPLSRGSFLKVSHRNHIQIHKLLGTSAIISSIIKGATVWSTHFNLFYQLINSNNNGSPVAGTVSTLFAILSPLPLLCKITRYELFILFHRVIVLVICLSAFLHYSTSAYYIAPSILLFLLDVVYRYYNTHTGLYTYVRKSGTQSYVTFNITLDSKPKVVPGCFYMVCFRNISVVEWHPFSLISKTRDTYTFCARNIGNNTWTSKLLDMEDLEKTLGDSAYIQGPFTGTQTSYDKDIYSHLMFCCSGISLATFFTIFEDIVRHKLLHLVSIQVVWSVHDLEIVSLFTPYIKKLVENTNASKLPLFNIQIYNRNEKDITQLKIPCVLVHNNDLLVQPILKKFRLHGTSRAVLVSGNDIFIHQVVSQCCEQGVECEIF